MHVVLAQQGSPGLPHETHMPVEHVKPMPHPDPEQHGCPAPPQPDWHIEPTQLEPDGQRVPHAPQFVASLVVSTQSGPHDTVPAAQPVQAPSTQ